MESITNNGVVTITGDSSSLSLDKTNFVSGSASVRFKILSTGVTSALNVTDYAPLDITEYANEGSIFALINFPTLDNYTTPINSISIRFGQDNSNYKQITVTRPHDSSTFKFGWNLVRFDLNKSDIEVGTPTYTNTKYLSLIFNSNVINKDLYINVDQITVRKGDAYQLGYYSVNIFKDYNTGALKDRPTSDTDIVLLEKDSIN
jgi:hypothetical protein